MGIQLFINGKLLSQKHNSVWTFNLLKIRASLTSLSQTTKSFFKHFPESEDQTIRMVPANIAVHALYEIRIPVERHKEPQGLQKQGIVLV
jgi:hypothetical protein